MTIENSYHAAPHLIISHLAESGTQLPETHPVAHADFQKNHQEMVTSWEFMGIPPFW
jgi:hypothetical protein